MKRKVTLTFLVVSLGLMFNGNLTAQAKTAAGTYNDGLALLKEKNYEKGLSLMEEALAMGQEIKDDKIIELAMKNGAIAAFNVGNERRKNDNYDGAIKAYERGIELNSEYSLNYEGVARALEDKESTIEAIKYYIIAGDKGLAEGKEDRAQSRYNKASVMVGKLFIANEYEKAISAGEAFIELKKDDPEVYYYMARSLAELKNNEKSIETIAQAINLAGAAVPDKYNYALATAYEALGKNTEAIEAYKKITEETYKAQAEYRIRELGG